MSQLIKPQIKWTPEKIQLLKDEYPLGDKNELAKRLGIKRSTLKDAAKRFKVKCLNHPNGKFIREYKAKNLLNSTLESYYWHGFIMADGHIGKANNITITLSEKDSDHLEKLKSFLLFDGELKYRQCNTSYSLTIGVCLNVTDADTCERIRTLYNVGSRKTTEPPVIYHLLDDKDKFLSFFIGLFDGDGCFDIRNSKVSNLKIECHCNWFDTLSIISKGLKDFFDIDSTLKITKRGYSCFRIYKQANFIKLKKFITDNTLPAMERKWNNITL